MSITRRDLLAAAGAAAVWTTIPGELFPEEGDGMYGLIGQMNAVPGKRDELIAILLAGVSVMPGCLSYVVAKDPTDPDALWVTEVWDRRESHEASLALPSVKEAIAKGRPLIAGFGERFETEPVGGHGLAKSGR